MSQPGVIFFHPSCCGMAAHFADRSTFHLHMLVLQDLTAGPNQTYMFELNVEMPLSPTWQHMLILVLHKAAYGTTRN